MVRVAVNGYGVIGKRVADAVVQQSEIVLAGISDIGRDWRLHVATARGLRLFGATAEHADAVSSAGLDEVDIVVECPPKRIAARNADEYRRRARTRTPILQREPVSLVEVASDGTVYAFMLGHGQLRASEPAAMFATVSEGFGTSYLLHLTVDPSDPNRLFAASADGEILHSIDHGRTWRRLAGAAPAENKE
ncbi:hypothetical protein [Propylenella binzhouense]|uniref:Glyceraldehyde 3-phosphate dehydrogenase NAD(P) binding domain-containing protein n=1 Tax=Propylenella binzhouense TaxID=2555902 RepID=A0A964T1L9_9HYPH|nr:hypothetical protein [Propylenella binzhouense]MYZ46319.1 hypothetical protein [Propylenella binzhouense]